MAKLSGYPVKYTLDYNAPLKRTNVGGKYGEGKVAAGNVEARLKSLEQPTKTTQIKISRVEASLSKVRKEAAKLLGCREDQAVLVKEGKVLKDEDVEIVRSSADLPVYIFNNENWSSQQLPILNGSFKKELVSLLKRYKVGEAEFVADRFLSDFPSWIQGKDK